MQAYVSRVDESYLFAYGSDGRVFVHVRTCEFDLADCQIGDELDIERIDGTERGLRAAGRVRWIGRPRETQEVTGAVVRLRPERGFAFMQPDDGGPTVFLNAHEFVDYDKGFSREFSELAPGDRVRCGRVPSDRGPRGVQIQFEWRATESAA